MAFDFSTVGIPVSFDYCGKHYDGFLCSGKGAAQVEGNQYDLMINGFFQGRLRLSQFNNEWLFDSIGDSGRFAELVDYFSQVVVSWTG